MPAAYLALQNYWAKYLRTKSGAPYVHPDDDTYLSSIGYWENRSHLREGLTFEKYVQSRRFEELRSSDFHFSLQPMPHAGDLSKAVVFILLLNPGFARNDYYAEYRDADYRRRLDQNIAQDFAGIDFPFFYLDPTFCWTTGFQWWEGKLRGIIETLAERHFKSSYRKALEFTSQRVASIELIPYHSKKFGYWRMLGKMPSAVMAQETASSIVQDVRVRKGCVVVTRQISAWKLPMTDSVVCYGPAEARAAHLTPGSRGGSVILDRLDQ